MKIKLLRALAAPFFSFIAFSQKLVQETEIYAKKKRIAEEYRSIYDLPSFPSKDAIFTEIKK